MTVPAIDARTGLSTSRPGPGRRAGGGPLRGLLRGPSGQPAWARPALLALLGLTAVLYLAGLGRNAWANDFYSAAVQAGSTSWKAFFFGSFDASSFISVDKTPASLWVMDLSARIFGLNYWSVLVPQALEGVACVGVLYAAVRRWFGPAAGLLAGAVLALTPVAALMFRFNNPDALLVLLLTLAAYAMTRAVESGRTRWIALAGTLIGFGFLAKMLQAVLVLPPFALAYLIAGPPRLGRRLLQLLAGAAAVIISAGWWVAAVMLTPAADRPYVGGSTSNSIVQLALGYNGLGRLDGNETGSVGFGGAAHAAAGPPGGGGQGAAFGGSTGLTRLFGSVMGGQISWLLPAALIALVALLWLTWRAPRTDRTRAVVASAAAGRGPRRRAGRRGRARRRATAYRAGRPGPRQGCAGTGPGAGRAARHFGRVGRVHPGHGYDRAHRGDPVGRAGCRAERRARRAGRTRRWRSGRCRPARPARRNSRDRRNWRNRRGWRAGVPGRTRRATARWDGRRTAPRVGGAGSRGTRAGQSRRRARRQHPGQQQAGQPAEAGRRPVPLGCRDRGHAKRSAAAAGHPAADAGHRRLQRLGPGADACPVQAAGLGRPDSLFRRRQCQQLRRRHRIGSPDHFLGGRALHVADGRRRDRLRPRAVTVSGGQAGPGEGIAGGLPLVARP